MLTLEVRPDTDHEFGNQGFSQLIEVRMVKGHILLPGSSLQTHFSSSGQQKPDTGATMDKNLHRAKDNTLEAIRAD